MNDKFFKINVDKLCSRLPQNVVFNESQKAMLLGLEENRFFVHVAARRTGKSYSAAIIAFILQKSHSSRCSPAQAPGGVVVHLRRLSSMFSVILSIWLDSSKASCWMVVCSSGGDISAPTC